MQVVFDNYGHSEKLFKILNNCFNIKSTDGKLKYFW